MVEDHFNAVKAMLTADPDLKVHDSALLDKDGGLVREAYVILYPTLPVELSSGRFAADDLVTSRATFVFDLRCVAATAVMAGRVQERALAQLMGLRPVVAGRRTQAIRLESVEKVIPDNTVAPPLFYGDLSIRFLSLP